MAKFILLEEFHLTVYARRSASDAERERMRRVLLERSFRRQLRAKIAEAIAGRPELGSAVVRLTW